MVTNIHKSGIHQKKPEEYGQPKCKLIIYLYTAIYTVHMQYTPLYFIRNKPYRTAWLSVDVRSANLGWKAHWRSMTQGTLHGRHPPALAGKLQVSLLKHGTHMHIIYHEYVSMFCLFQVVPGCFLCCHFPNHCQLWRLKRTKAKYSETLLQRANPCLLPRGNPARFGTSRFGMFGTSSLDNHLIGLLDLYVSLCNCETYHNESVSSCFRCIFCTNCRNMQKLHCFPTTTKMWSKDTPDYWHVRIIQFVLKICPTWMGVTILEKGIDKTLYSHVDAQTRKVLRVCWSISIACW